MEEEVIDGQQMLACAAASNSAAADQSAEVPAEARNILGLRFKPFGASYICLSIDNCKEVVDMTTMMKKIALGAMVVSAIGVSALTPASAQRFGGVHGGGFGGRGVGVGIGAAAVGAGIAAGALAAGANGYGYGYGPYGYDTGDGYAPAYNAPAYGYAYPGE